MLRLAWPALLLALPACAAPVPGPDELAANRRKNIDRLRAYALRGEFPRNEQFPGKHMPVFVDRHGTACAVAHLMVQDGRTEAVREIASSDNHVRIADVRKGPLLDWIRTSGLTQEECAIIQPGYPWRRRQAPRVPPLNTAYAKADRSWGLHLDYGDSPDLPKIRGHLLGVIDQLEGNARSSGPSDPVEIFERRFEDEPLARLPARSGP